jgi:hypothetical protein
VKETRILYKRFYDVLRQLADRRYPLNDLYLRFQADTRKSVENRLKFKNGQVVEIDGRPLETDQASLGFEMMDFRDPRLHHLKIDY